MKMTQTDFDYLSAQIKMIDSTELRAKYSSAGLSLKRYQWDITWKAGLTTFICDVLYKYLNDDHIQTALNRIVNSLEVK